MQTDPVGSAAHTPLTSFWAISFAPLVPPDADLTSSPIAMPHIVDIFGSPFVFKRTSHSRTTAKRFTLSSVALLHTASHASGFPLSQPRWHASVAAGLPLQPALLPAWSRPKPSAFVQTSAIIETPHLAW